MRLNIGCGPVLLEDWTNVDPDPQWGADFRSLIAFVPDSADGAVAHHVLQMIAWPDLVPWLTEVRRVLKPGAVLRISVPDLYRVRDWLDRPWDEDDLPPIADEHEASKDGKVCLWVSQAGATRSVFTDSWLMELCQRAGFARALSTNYQSTRLGPPWLLDLDHLPDRSTESVYVEAMA